MQRIKVPSTNKSRNNRTIYTINIKWLTQYSFCITKPFCSNNNLSISIYTYFLSFFFVISFVSSSLSIFITIDERRHKSFGVYEKNPCHFIQQRLKTKYLIVVDPLCLAILVPFVFLNVCTSVYGFAFGVSFIGIMMVGNCPSKHRYIHTENLCV